MARTTKPTSNIFDYTVEQLPLYDREGKAVRVGGSPIMGNFRTDNGICLGTSTEKYEIVNNKDAVDIVEDAFSRAGLGDFDREMVVAREGSRFYGVYDFPTMQRHIANKGDVVALRLTLNNSFDRSCGLNWAMGMLRKVCTNGMCSLIADTNVTKKHSSKLDLSFINDGIQLLIEKFEKGVDAFKNLGEREITQNEGGLILDNLANKKILSDSLRDSIQMIWESPSFGEDQGRNLYNLYNATTEHLSREVQPTRFEYANRVSRSVLANLSKAQADRNHFQKLTSALPKKEKVATEINLAAN
jgi:hypothetical protein|tara:strand:- start:1048 stop:1950 length:903 start_codon:yes stop_codon:yes gene_type:complete